MRRIRPTIGVFGCLLACGVTIATAGCGSESDTPKPRSSGGKSGAGGALGASGAAGASASGGAVGAAGSGGFGGASGQGTGGTTGPGGAAGSAGQPSGGNGGSGGDTGGSGGTGTNGASGTDGSAGSGTGGTAGSAGGSVGTSGASGTAGTAGTAGAGGSGGQALPPVTDYAARGPFMTTSTPNTGPGNRYTIYRPNPLGENGFVHSPMIFGPGIATQASQYRALLDHLASHGLVTISVNSMSGGPGAAANLTAMREGLDWIIAQNGQAGVFQGKLAVNRAVTMGYSIGATASVQLSSHPAIITTFSIHGHNTSGDPHGPVILLTGTEDVIAANRTTLTTLTEAPAVLMALPIGHLDVIAEIALGGSISANARYIAPITAWVRYWVNGDQNAKSFFWGNGCKMCTTPWITPEPNAKWTAQML